MNFTIYSKRLGEMRTARSFQPGSEAAFLRRVCRARVVSGLIAVVALLGGVGAASASAAPVWQPSVFAPQRVAPGKAFTFSIKAKNTGDTVTDGSGALDVTLPPGVSGISALTEFGFPLAPPFSSWTCNDPAGLSSLHCDLSSSVEPGQESEAVYFRVTVNPAASGVLTSAVEMAGGGASGSKSAARSIVADPTSAFGISAFDGAVADSTGQAFTRAGGHPYLASTTFEFNKAASDTGDLTVDGGNVKTIQVDLPAGFVGNPASLPSCPMEEFLRPVQVYTCPNSSQVGYAQLKIILGNRPPFLLQGSGDGTIPLFNLEPRPGVAAAFGFIASNVPVFLEARVSGQGGYHVTVTSSNTSQVLGILQSSATLWGNPADPIHDSQRACHNVGPPFAVGCAADVQPLAFLANPTFCPPAGQGLKTDLSVDSWANPGVFEHASFVSHLPPGYSFDNPLAPSEWGMPQGPTGCDRVPFDPSADVDLDTRMPDAPAGVKFDLSFPQEGLLSPWGTATAHLKRAEVTFPEGLTVSPSAADGLQACSDEQIGFGSDGPVGCPNASKIGTVTATTPLLHETLTGGLYVGSQLSDDPESGRMFRVFIALESKERGILVKLPGEVRAIGDPAKGTATIKTTFDNNPQVPVSSISVKLDSGPRAPLATPQTCGQHTVKAVLSSWAGQTVQRQDSFTIDCPPDAGSFSPLFEAGAVSPTGGTFSPFAVRINRPDRQQALSGAALELPGGTLAKLKGVPLCGEADAAAGTCPVASRIGTATVGAGPGPQPFYIKGPVALTGPYQGAPYGLSVAVRAVAGPFDLGTVVVRQAIYIDPVDAHLMVVSDPLPTVVKGVPVRLRSVSVDVDRPRFTLNPTNCAEKQIAATFSSITGAISKKTSRFQASDCAHLPFSPKLAIRLTGKRQLTDGKHPGLKATLTQPAKQAGIKSVKVALPLSLALDPENAASDDLCEFEEGQKLDPKCPASSIIGTAKATTPLLNRPLAGKVYFVKNVRIDKRTGRRIRTLPTLLLALRGEVSLNVKAQSTVENNKLVSTFATVPDAPVTRFDLTLKGGPKGILVVNGNACKRSNTANIALRAQNTKRKTANTHITTPCTKKQE